MTSVLQLERLGTIALLTLDRPERLNAIGSGFVAELHAHLDLVEGDETLRAIVVTGAGRAFSAGADISELATLANGEDFAHFVTGLTDAYARLSTSPVPSIAAINGIALGGGCELALACDLRLAAPGARIGVPEIKLGLLPAGGGSQRLARFLPPAAAKHMLLTGTPLTAEDAYRLGLVNSIHDDVLAAALGLAASLAEGPPQAMAAAKRLVDHGGTLPFEAGVAMERDAVAELFDSEDRVEGLEAFAEKRSPRFTGHRRERPPTR